MRVEIFQTHPAGALILLKANTHQEAHCSKARAGFTNMGNNLMLFASNITKGSKKY